MSTLLALDASSSACSCAVWHQGEVLSRFALTPREHTRRLMPMIEDVLSAAGLSPESLDALAYGRGPGSFTGLRIAAGVAQGLAFGLDRPLIGISTLEALALAAHRRHRVDHVIPMLDARMSEVYVAAYYCSDGNVTRLMDETVTAPQQLHLPDGWPDAGWCGIGSGWTLGESIPLSFQTGMSQCLPDIQPAAEEIVQLAAKAHDAGQGQAPHEAVPVYLRNQVAWQRG